MFTKLKLWLALGGGVLLAMGALLLRLIGIGRQIERAKGIEEAAKAEEKHDGHVVDAIQAGDAARESASDPDRLRTDDGYKRKPVRRSAKRGPKSPGV